MKKIIRIYLAVLCMAAGLAVCMSSTDTVYADSSGDFEYGTFPSDGTVCVDRYTGSDKNVVIPEMIDGKLVTAIGAEMFVDSEITSVTIPSGVTEIEHRAFLRCRKLVSVTLPDTVKIIEEWAFAYCESLKSINLQSGLLQIGDHAFIGCTNLAEFHIPESVTEIGKSAFAECEGLTSVQIPDGVTQIKEDTFRGWKRLINVQISENVTQIGRQAFDGCENLTNINLPKNLTEIGNAAFFACVNLKRIQIPESVTQIGRLAFCSCNSLEEVKIPEGIAEIEEGTFNGCKNLTEVQLSSSLKSIGKEAFSYCTKLETVRGSGSNIEIGESAFERCRSLRSILITGITKIADHAFDFSTLSEINLDDVESIGREAFLCTRLTVVNIPNVKTIGGGAFDGCTLLEEVNFPAVDPVTESAIFRECNKLTNIRFPHGITTVREGDLRSCFAAQNVYFSDTITSIDMDVFIQSALQTIEVDEKNTVYCSIDGVLFDKKKETLLRFPSKRKGDYHIPDGTVKISEMAFYNSPIENLYMPASVKSIDKAVFLDYLWHCNLKNIYYAGTKEQWNNIQNNDIEQLIDAKVMVHFQDGSTLKMGSLAVGAKVTIDEFDYEVTAVGENPEVKVIRMNVSQTKASVPYTIYVGSQTFNVTAIADGAFAGRKTLKELIISRHIESIGKNAFKGCSNLRNINIISTNLKSVGKNAFKGIYAGAKIKVPSNKLAAYKKVLKGKGLSRKAKITN